MNEQASEGTMPTPKQLGQLEESDPSSLGFDSATKDANLGDYRNREAEKQIANLSPEDYLKRFLDRATRELPQIDQERLRGSAERVSSYFNGKLQDIDGQPLPINAAEAALSSIRLERDNRVSQVLLEIAGSPIEALGQQIKDAALDTVLIGAAIDQDADLDPWEIHKNKLDPMAYKDYAEKRPQEGLPEIPSLDTDTTKIELPRKDLRLRGRLHPVNLVQGLLRIVGRGRNNAIELNPSPTTNSSEGQVVNNATSQDQIREELQRLTTNPQQTSTEPPSSTGQAPIIH